MDRGYPSKRPRANTPFRAIPSGWGQCPKFGQPLFNAFIPMKAPIGGDLELKIPLTQRFSPTMAVREMAQAGYRVTHVLDLTNTSRYYRPDEFERMNVKHIKVPCQGRGEVPDPDAVNRAIHELRAFHAYAQPGEYCAIHCTHGFNRTGYIICCALVRFQAGEGMVAERALRRFAAARPPGIYKHHYISELLLYHHEWPRSSRVLTPPLPDWKAAGSASPDDNVEPTDHELQQLRAAPTSGLQHDDDFGEVLDPVEEGFIQQRVYDAIWGQQGSQGPRGHDGTVRFPGSQPVSLARANMYLLHQRRYWVTWKADGTRYFMYITHHGCYLIDRNMKVRRLQMRFPTPRTSTKQAHPVGPPHNETLLDGELIIDTDEQGAQHRRFLPYDMMMNNGQPLCTMPFEVRWKAIMDSVVKPRKDEEMAIFSQKVMFRYSYLLEPLRVRRKEFWPLTQATKLFKMMAGMSEKNAHPCDGVILQAYGDPYKPGTCEELLKWKFVHMNSVDFKVQLKPSVRPGPGVTEDDLLLCVTSYSRGRAELKPQDKERLRVPPDADMTAAEMPDKVIECSYDPQEKCWVYMRQRKDKSEGNALRTYEKVKQSIDDNITEADILNEFASALTDDHYAADVAVAGGAKALALPPRRALPPPPPQMQQQQRWQQEEEEELQLPPPPPLPPHQQQDHAPEGYALGGGHVPGYEAEMKPQHNGYSQLPPARYADEDEEADTECWVDIDSPFYLGVNNEYADEARALGLLPDDGPQQPKPDERHDEGHQPSSSPVRDDDEQQRPCSPPALHSDDHQVPCSPAQDDAMHEQDDTPVGSPQYDSKQNSDEDDT